jgi:hypothetical protein
VGIPAEAVVDRKKLKEYQNSKFEQYAINSKKQSKQYVVGFDEVNVEKSPESVEK